MTISEDSNAQTLGRLGRVAGLGTDSCFGQVEIRENDIYGLNVNFTSRVQHALPGEAILVTDRVQRDYDRKFGKDSGVRFIPREVPLKSFGKETVLFVATPELAKARRNHFEARTSLLRA